MAVPESPLPPVTAPARPTLSPGWRWFMRLSGAVALLLFLTPTVYVVKYFAVDRPREAARARRISLVPPAPPPALDSVAPPLAPGALGNAAFFYTRAFQSYADRLAAGHRGFLPTPEEAQAVFEGARRRDCRFFVTNWRGRPRFFFRDHDAHGAPLPYEFPRSVHEPYRYLSAAEGLAEAMARLPALMRPGDRQTQVTVGQSIVRLGAAVGRERATYTHLFVSKAIQRVGLRLLLPFRGAAFKQYVYGLQAADVAAQAKYAWLESSDPDNMALQERVARADPDALWRREAVWALGMTAAQPGVAVRRPLEVLTAKATLAEVAGRDPDLSVRAAAAQTLGEVARGGAVIRR